MSLRIDASELISGAYVIGETGLGVLGSAVPSTGTYGASYLYNDLVLPADAGKEIRGLILTVPSAGTFFAYEDGSFSLVGAPDSTYQFDYRLYTDGVASAVDIGYGAGVSRVTVGIGGTSMTGGVALGDLTVSGSMSSAAVVTSQLSGSIVLSGVVVSGSIDFGGATPALTNTEMQQMYAWLSELAGKNLLTVPTYLALK